MSKVTILKAEVPPYLHNSDFFKSLDEESDEAVTLDASNLKLTPAIESDDDLIHYLSTVRFWGYDTTDELIAYCFAMDGKRLGEVAKLFPELTIVAVLSRLVSGQNQNSTEQAIRHGNIAVVACLHQNGVAWEEHTMSTAAQYGQLECMKYAHEHGCPWDNSTLYKAISYNHIDCLHYACENGCPPTVFAAAAACRQGRLDVIQYLRSHDCPWNTDATFAAAQYGKYNCLMYAHQLPHVCTSEWLCNAS
jgi:hypothetical protein